MCRFNGRWFLLNRAFGCLGDLDLFFRRRLIAVYLFLSATVDFPFNSHHPLANPDGGLIIVSEKVGEEITREEAERYKLFSNVLGFQSARWEKIDLGKYEMVIKREGGDSIRVRMGGGSILALRDYLEDFDRISTAKEARVSFERRQEIVGYDIFGIPFTKEEIRVASHKEKGWASIACGGTFGLFVGSLLGWKNAVDYVGQGNGCLSYNIYEVRRPEFLGYSIAGGVAGSGIGYHIQRGANLKSAKEKMRMRGFAYFGDDGVISEETVKNYPLQSGPSRTSLAFGLPASILGGIFTAVLAYEVGKMIRGIGFFDKIIGEEVLALIALTIGIGTFATEMAWIIKRGQDIDRREIIRRIKKDLSRGESSLNLFGQDNPAGDD